MPTQQTKIISDLSECEQLWKRFSPNNNLWDDWEINRTLHNPAISDPFFLVLIDNKKETGILPLMIEINTGTHYFFGGKLPEARRLWFDLKYFNLFFEKIQNNTQLLDMNATDARKITMIYPEYKDYFVKPDRRYYVNLQAINWSFDNYLKNKFSGERRKKFLADIRKVNELGLDVSWSKDIHLDLFIEMNKKRFGKDSDYNKEENILEARRLLKLLKEKSMLQTLTISSSGKIQAVSLSALYKETLHVIYASNNQDVKNLGKKMHVLNIQRGIDLKAKEVDFMIGDNSWKEFWKMDREECLSFIK
jgi:hypothetical protein